MASAGSSQMHGYLGKRAEKHLDEIDALRQRLLRVSIAVHHCLHCRNRT